MKNKALVSLIVSMLIFGTVGIFRRYIPLSSGFVAFSRGIIGFVFLALFFAAKKQKFSFDKIKEKFLLLCLSGALMGFNWIMLFESYNHTSVATATLCYYMAPVFVIMASPFLFGEKIGKKKAFCVFGAILGMVLVSGIFENSFGGFSELKGVLLGLGAAMLYASVVILNKKTAEVPSFEKTFVQLGSAAAVILPYTFFAEEISLSDFNPLSVTMLLILGILHTGIAYVLYFGSIGSLPAQTTAILSYVDPASAVVLSFIILGEGMTVFGLLGAVLIIGSAVISEKE